MPDAEQLDIPSLHLRPNAAEQNGPPKGARSLPSDLFEASVRRLGAIALLYSSVFFLAAIFPNVLCLLFAQFVQEMVCNPAYFTTFRMIGPPVLSVMLGLGVFWLVRLPSLSLTTKLNVGLAFEVLGSVGIAASEYQGIISAVKYTGMENLADAGTFGLSWVSMWVLLFTIVIPSPPRRALMAAVLSVSAVPIAFAVYVAFGINTVTLQPAGFFFALVFPYILTVGMAYVAARVVYQLGSEVRRARELGSYRLVELLGEGGMGEVWRAEHRLLARPAAVKLIRPEALGATGVDRSVIVQRFEREAQATASLRCPHSVELYDFGISDEGACYYVMELLEGYDLDMLVGRFGPLPAERVVHMLIQICQSLGEAHDVGLIHRDIKPANVYTCRFGRTSDWIKVLDFGLVKRFGADAAVDQKLTSENVIGGTPGYIAPEQVLGRLVDGRADLYALGCVAYWLMTGQQPFTGRTPMETMMRHVNDAPVPPSQRTELTIPEQLEEVVLACLAKDPADRPQTAFELATLLSSISLEQPWTSERSLAWWNTNSPQPRSSKALESTRPI